MRPPFARERDAEILLIDLPDDWPAPGLFPNETAGS
jgi:hypothetical protein